MYKTIQTHRTFLYINFSMNDMQWVFTRIITTVLARRRRQCDYVWLYMPSWGRQSLWIRLVELSWRQAHRPQYSQEWRSHISSTYQTLYICDYKRRESTNFAHKIVCFVIIFDLLRLVVLSYKQEENMCILRRRDVLSLHFLFLFSILLALFSLLFPYDDQLLSKWKGRKN